MDVFTTCGMKLPIIHCLGDDVYVVAHPNGPAVATIDTLTTLERACDCEFIDDEAVYRAVAAYVAWSWPAAKAAHAGEFPAV